MNRDKQIEEMAKHCHFYEEGKCLLLEDEAEECDTKCDMCEFAKRLYNAGYRKADEVAREIIDILKSVGIDEWRYPVIAELKKMYLEEVK